MKRQLTWLPLILVVLLSTQRVAAQEEEERPNPLIFSIGARLVLQGFEMGFEHRISEKYSMRTSLGVDNRYSGDKTFNNKDLVVSMHGNSRSFPYGLAIGPYLKLKDSYYSYSPPGENFMLDAYSSLYFFGTGLSAEYRQKIGMRLLISPFARFGINRVVLRNDTGPGTNPFTDTFEADINAGIRVGFVFQE